MKYLLIIIILLVSITYSKANNIIVLYNKVDSLYDIDKTKCLSYAKKLEKLALKQLNDTSLAYAYNKQANIYYKNKKYNKSIKYFEKELEIREKTSSKYVIAELYYNLGSTCLKINKPKKAEIYFNKSLIIAKKINDDILVYAIYSALYVTNKEAGHYKMALEYLLKMQKIDESEYNQSIGLFKKKYFEQRQITKKKSDQLNDAKTNLGNTRRKLYTTKKKLYNTNDSLDSAINVVNTLAKDTALKNYEINSLKIRDLIKENELEKQKYNLQKRNLIIYYLIGGFAFILIFSLLIFKLFLAKKKMNKELIIQKNEIAIQNHRIGQSIEYGRKIQKAILPSDKLFNEIFKDYFIIYEPRDVVSGDFYWMHKTDNEYWIAVADCTGHGVPGAFMSMIGNTLLNKIVRYNNVNKPSELLLELNSEVKLALSQNSKEEASDDGMDMSIIKIDRKTKSATIALANHSTFVLNNNGISKIEGDIYSIGGLFSDVEGIEFTDHIIPINDSTTVYMFSDGYQDQFGGEHEKKYTIDRIEKKILSIKDEKLSKQKLFLESELNNWKGNNEQIDDILMIGINLNSIKL